MLPYFSWILDGADVPVADDGTLRDVPEGDECVEVCPGPTGNINETQDELFNDDASMK